MAPIAIFNVAKLAEEGAQLEVAKLFLNLRKLGIP